MPHATEFARQWAGIVAQVRMFGAHASQAKLIEGDGMVASVMPAAPTSSLMNVALSVDPTAPPTSLHRLSDSFRQAGAQKWGLWVDGDDANAAEAATEHGLVLDSRPAAMVANLDALPFDDAPPANQAELATVGRINDAAYGYDPPKLTPAIGALPDTVITYGAQHDGTTASVAMAHDVGSDTAVWFVATLPQAQRNGLAQQILRRLLLDARERGQATASLQASPKGRPLYERLGFTTVGELHLYEERF
jgi:ribosomal protein S18 acetylase RimI-like enzyme